MKYKYKKYSKSYYEQFIELNANERIVSFSFIHDNVRFHPHEVYIVEEKIPFKSRIRK